MIATAEITIASKQLVDSLLAMNTNNRNIRKSVVAKYVKDIKSGNWHLTNQGIGVSETGILIDGQQRLTAIKDCGYPPVQLLIVRGLKEESRLCVDVHAKRSMRDMLVFAFKDRVAHHAPAICRALIVAEKAWAKEAISVNDIIETMEEHQEEIEAITSAPRNSSFYAAAFLAGFVAMAKKTGRIDDVVTFMRQVEDGEMLTKDMPAYHLRNVVTDKSAAGGGGVSSVRFAKAVRATKAFLSGEKLKVLKV
jgi:hypothetical protein